MKKRAPFRIFLILLLITQYGFSQVDVVYNHLVWSDEFNDNGPVDSGKWFHQTQLPQDWWTWYNGELQHYTNRTANSFVDGGALNIVAKKETFTDQNVTKDYTSARLNSKFSFTYGRVDVRAKVPINQGAWPAIWMLGKNIKEIGGYYNATYGDTNWPACGEIDIMERGIFPTQPVDYIQGTLHTPSSSENSVNHGSKIVTNLQNDFHIYSINWSPNQISFLVDNVIYYTYNPAVKNASTWPFDKEQFLLLNIAMGGPAGTIPGNFSQASMVIDYVKVFQTAPVDTQKPTNFTATVGAVTGSSVELLLNAVDNSGNVNYTINYGTTNTTVSSPSGVQKSVIIPNLASGTAYNFAVSASDASGNIPLNNPILLSATTSSNPDTGTGCNGTSNEAIDGAFTVGYKYAFETTGTDVKITFELLDRNKVGVVAFLWRQTPFTETQMTNVSGNIFTQTINGQTPGSTISYAVKFAYAGGLSATKYFSYVVGNNCTLGLSNTNELEQFSFKNPAKDYVNINSKIAIDKVEIYTIQGSLVSSIKGSTNQIDVKNLSSGVYLLAVYSANQKSVKKLIIE